MELVVLGSSSKGNGYVLKGAQESLCIEAGVKLIEVKKAMGFDMRGVRGCIISHEHNDHARYAKDYADGGVRVLALENVLQAKGIERNSFAVQQGKTYKLGGFMVAPFALQHDVPCVGYLISHAECGRVAFITDTFACNYRFRGVSQYMLECNYADDILTANITAGKIPVALRNRLLTSHMELDSTVGFLQSSDLSQVQKVVLIHLSDGNSDERRFVQVVREATGKRVYAATAGMVLPFNKSIL